jgi:hypothetical protein
MKTIGKGLGPNRQIELQDARRGVKDAERHVRDLNDQLSDAASVLKTARMRLARAQTAAERNPR